MESLRIDILNPRAKKIIEELASLNLITIKKNSDVKKDFFELVEKLRAKKSNVTLEEITKEVELVRSKNYQKK